MSCWHTLHFTSEVTGNLMNPLGMTLVNSTQLAHLCPIPHVWAASFLDWKTPFEAWEMGCDLITTLDTADECDRVSSLRNWLGTACVRCGLVAGDQCFSCLGTDWAALAPDAQVMQWASRGLTPYMELLPPSATGVAMPMGLAPVTMAASAASTTMDYTPLKIQKI
jgi:hypothetical protein